MSDIGQVYPVELAPLQPLSHRKTLESLLQPQTLLENRSSSCLLARQLDQGWLQGWQKCKCSALAPPGWIMRKRGGDHLCTRVVLLALGGTFTVTLGSLILASDPALVKVGGLSHSYSRKRRMSSLENHPIVLSSLASFTVISHEQCPMGCTWAALHGLGLPPAPALSSAQLPHKWPVLSPCRAALNYNQSTHCICS